MKVSMLRRISKPWEDLREINSVDYSFQVSKIKIFMRDEFTETVIAVV